MDSLRNLLYPMFRFLFLALSLVSGSILCTEALTILYNLDNDPQKPNYTFDPPSATTKNTSPSKKICEDDPLCSCKPVTYTERMAVIRKYRRRRFAAIELIAGIYVLWFVYTRDVRVLGITAMVQVLSRRLEYESMFATVGGTIKTWEWSMFVVGAMAYVLSGMCEV